MSKSTVKVVEIDTNPAVKSLKDLRKELMEYKNQMANLDEGSDAFLEVANKAGEVKHQIDEINESIKGASSDFGDMVGNVTNVAAGITGAFQAVAGGLQAMGVESEAVDKAIAKMQGLMAVTQGLSAIDDGIKSFDKLRKSIGFVGDIGAKSMGKLKKALIGTGIGALVVIVGSLIANWEEFTKSIGISEEKMVHFGNVAKGVLNAVKEMFSNIARGIALLFSGDFAKAGEAFKAGFNFKQNFEAGVAKAEEDAKQEKLDRERDLQEELYEIEKERLNRVDDEKKKNKELLKLEKERLTRLTKGTKEYEAQLTTIYNIEKNLKKIEAERLEQEKEKKRLAEEQEKERQRLAEEEAQRLKKEEYKKLNLQIDVSELSDFDKLIARLNLETSKLLEITDETSIEYLEQYKIVLALSQAFDDLMKKQEDRTYNLSEQQKTYWKTFEKYTQQEGLTIYEIFKQEEENLRLLFEQGIISLEEYTEALDRLREARQRQLIKDTINVATAASNIVTGLLDGIADQQDTNNKEGFEKSKRLQIASATIGMLTGITNAIAGLFTTKSGPWDIALAAIQAATIAANGAMQINKIKSTTFDSGATASVNSGSVGSMIMPPVQFSSAVQSASTEGAITNQKVYVLESDIVNTIGKVNVQESENTY